MTPAIVFVLLTMGAQAAGQVTGTLTGLVVDAGSGVPVADARVALVEAGRTIATTADGRFEFAGIAAGEHTLTVSTIGYIFVRRRVTVTAGAPVDLTVPVTEGTGTYRETVTVSADPASGRDPGVSAGRDLGSAALQDLRGVAADDPIRAIQALPGVATGDDFQAEFSIRGSAFRHVGIVIDGVAAPFLLHAVRGADDTGSITMVNTDVLDKASLSAGAAPQRHGEWLGGTLAFDLRDGSRDRHQVRAAVSGTSASSVLEGPIGPGRRGSWLFSIRKSYVDWLIRKLEPDIDATIGFADMQGKLVYDVTARQQVQLLVVGGDATYRQHDARSANQIARAESTGGLAALGWRRAGDRTLVSSRIAWTSSTFHNRGASGQAFADGRIASTVWRADIAHVAGAGWSLEGGTRIEQQDTDQTHREFRLTGGRLVVRAEQFLSGASTTSSVWAQAMRRTEGSGIVAGVRGTRDTLTGESAASPWLLVERRTGPLTWRAGAGRSVQVPLVELVRRAESPLGFERAWSLDAGVEHRLGRAFRWQFTAFRREDDHVIRRVGEDRLVGTTRVPETAFPVWRGALDGTTRGADLIVERRAAAGPSGWIGYTWAHTRYRDTVSGETFDGDYDQRHTLNVFVVQRVSWRTAVSAKLRVGSNFPIVGYFTGTPAALRLGPERNQVRLPVYVRLDLRADRTFTFTRSRLTLFAEVMNVLGRRNLGQADGSIRTSFEAAGFLERLMPRVPSVGILIEF